MPGVAALSVRTFEHGQTRRLGDFSTCGQTARTPIRAAHGWRLTVHCQSRVVYEKLAELERSGWLKLVSHGRSLPKTASVYRATMPGAVDSLSDAGSPVIETQRVTSDGESLSPQVPSALKSAQTGDSQRTDGILSAQTSCTQSHTNEVRNVETNEVAPSAAAALGGVASGAQSEDALSAVGQSGPEHWSALAEHERQAIVRVHRGDAGFAERRFNYSLSDSGRLAELQRASVSADIGADELL